MDSELEEIEVELGQRELNMIDRLVKEGIYESRGAAANEALIRSKNGKQDPIVKQRIEELNEIGSTAEQDRLAEFFADTTELMHLYGRMMEGDREMISDDLNSMYDIFQDRVLEPTRREEEYVQLFVEGIFDYFHELQMVLDQGTEEYERVENYLTRYNEQKVVEMM